MTKRLTDAEIEDCLSEVDTTLRARYVDKMFARAIEAKVLERSGAEPDQQLCKFYDVQTFPELVEAMEHHIRKLQSKLPIHESFAAPQAVKAEPVAWTVPECGFLFLTQDAAQRYLRIIGSDAKPTALYTAPQAVKEEPVTTSYAEARSALCVEANKLTAPQAVNQRLLEAAKRIRHWAEADNVNYTGDHPVALLRAAIAAAERGEA